MITAIVSAYFAEKYLKHRVQNLLEQSANPEVVVVCEIGSPEDTIMKGFVYTQVKIIQTNPGILPTVYDAWNRAIAHATGEFIVIANCDDIFYDGALEKMQNVLLSNPDVGLVYPDCDITKEWLGDPVDRFQFLPFDLLTMFQLCYIGPMPMWRKSLHETYGLFDAEMLVAGDYEFWLRIASAGVKFYHLQQAVGAYYNNRQGREHRESVRTLWETARAKSRYSNITEGVHL
jgi:GT2 family glycosyltransferase